MAIEFKCQGCQKTLRVPDEFAGRKARCPNCQTILQVAPADETVETQQVQPPIESSPDLFAGLDSSPIPDSSRSSYGQDSAPNPSPFANSNPYSSPQQQPQSRQGSGGAPHRGGLVLGLGVAAFLCNFCLIPGILALTLGLNDLKAMKAGRMDDEGHGLTLAGTILGGIATGLAALVFLFYIVVAIISVAMG